MSDILRGARPDTRRWSFTPRARLPDARRLPAIQPGAASLWQVGASLALLCLALYMLLAAGGGTSLDGGVMYDTTKAIVDRHTLALPPHHHGLPDAHRTFFYSKYGLAQSVAEIPLYMVGKAVAAPLAPDLAYVTPMAITMLTNGVITAASVWLFFLLAYELCGAVPGAAIAALLLGLASPYLVYAKTDFSEPLSALGLTGAVLFLIRARREPTIARFAVSGLFVALALLTKLTAGLALPFLLIYAVHAARAPDADGARPPGADVAVRLVEWGLGTALGLAVTAWYDLVRFGSIINTGYHGQDTPFNAPLWHGLQGLLVSTGKGLLLFCPLVVLALPLWPLLMRRRRAEALLALGIAATTLLVFATYPVWWGGVCWGPRYLVPVLPFILLPLAFFGEAFDRLKARPRRGLLPRRAAVVVVGLSLVVQVLGVAVHPGRFEAAGVSEETFIWTPLASPLLGNAWLLGHDALGGADRNQLVVFPWRGPGGISDSQRIAIDGWTYWWWTGLRRYGLHTRASVLLALPLLLLLALTAWRLRRLTT